MVINKQEKSCLILTLLYRRMFEFMRKMLKIFTRNRIVKNSQNPENGVAYLKEGERIPLGHLIVGYEPIPWEIKRHKISL